MQLVLVLFILSVSPMPRARLRYCAGSDAVRHTVSACGLCLVDAQLTRA